MANTKKKASKTTKTPKTKEEFKKEAKERRYTDKRVIDEIWAVIFIALGIFLFAAVQFHAAGELGNNIGDAMRGIFGLMGLIIPWYLVLFGIMIFAKKTAHISKISVLLTVLIVLLACILNSGRFIDGENIAFTFKDFYLSGIELKSGGFFGMTVGSLLVKAFGQVGLYVFSIVGIIISVLLVFNTPVSRGIDKVSEKRALRQLERENSDYEFEYEYTPALPEVQREDKTQRAGADMFSGSHQLSIEEIGNQYSSRKSKPRRKDESNVLRYMTDEDPFGRDGNVKIETSYGLEEKAYYGEGYGLEGKSKEKIPEEPKKQKNKTKAGLGLFGSNKEEKERSKPQKDTSSRDTMSFDPILNMDDDRFGISTYDSPIAEPNVAPAPKHVAEAHREPEAVTGVIVKEEAPKLTKKEASALTLDPNEMSTQKVVKVYKKPPIDLLNKPVVQNRGNLNYELKMKAAKLEETLQNFHVDARVIQVTQGPAVTRYEIQPNVGVKVNSIVRLSDDIALNLEAKSIRIEAPIPGKAAVGIEVENEHINMVTLREIVDSKEFNSAKSKITFAVGKDISGNAIVADLKDMPHLLIAGSTGSGKSVCINSIITSILYKADPEEVKLVLIDPKVVELGNYNGIPHLLIPVVTEPTKASAALNWAVAEMTDRYKKFAESQVRDLKSYNEAMKAKGEDDQVMPQIVIIIDELADLMMAAPSQVEESICRLAQMARAAGMHLIVATQRPSVDIITGVIKANIPSRIAFAVSSQFDSRTILDMSGAEKLVGKGDMLFNPLGTGKPLRVQGTFVSDKEVHDVIEFVKGQVEDVEYSGEVISTIEKGNLAQNKDDDGDELLADAIECVVMQGQASVSMLQRRFRIGYNRAARIVDMMEARGIVGPQDGSRPRQVLMTEDELRAMKEEVEE